MLAPQLDGIVPAYHLEEPTALAKAIVESLDQSTHAVPRPARHQKLDELAAKLTLLDPVRAEELAKAAMRLMLGAALDKATKKMGSRKNVTPDTPCPKLNGGEEPADPAA